jgi:DNA primase
VLIPIRFATAEVTTYYRNRAPHLKQRSVGEWRGACPIHHGKNDSFAVEPDTGRWFCHSTCGRGGDIIELEMALTGADFIAARTEALRIVGRIEPQYRRNGNRTNGKPAGTVRPKAVGWAICEKSRDTPTWTGMGTFFSRLSAI